jgi:hypothetical protein
MRRRHVYCAYCQRGQRAGEEESRREVSRLDRENEEGATRSRHARLLAGESLVTENPVFIAWMFDLYLR